MHDVLFENRYGERRVIGQAANHEEAGKIISDFLKAHHYKSYYTRMWEEDGKTWFDVGSHAELFLYDSPLPK